MNTPGVILVKSPMCRFGMSAEDEFGVGLVHKMTWYITNSPAIAQMLGGHCSNLDGGPQHRHVHLMDGRAAQAAVYPPALVKAILNGILGQMRLDGEVTVNSFGVTNEEPIIGASSPEEADEMMEYYDDVNSRNNLIRRYEKKGLLMEGDPSYGEEYKLGQITGLAPSLN